MRTPTSYGIFGKLPAKRDFVALDIPQVVLTPWETWLQREIAQSRQQLGRDWVAAFLKAPIWRFSCGSRVLGRAATGVLMPSVDGVGRYFPLTILALGAEGAEFPAPLGPHQSAIYDALETHILDALDPDCAYDGFIEGVRGLTPPEAVPEAEAGAFVSPPLETGSTGSDSTGPEPLASQHAALQRWVERRARAVNSIWWTQGGEGFAPRMLAVGGLPAGRLFAAMLTGAFDSAGEVYHAGQVYQEGEV